MLITEKDFNTYNTYNNNNTQVEINYKEDFDNLIVPAVLNKMRQNKTQGDLELEYEEQKQKETVTTV